MSTPALPTAAPFDDDDLDAARLGFTQGGSPADTRRYAGQLRAKAAAHRAYAERLDATADAIYRWATREERDGGGTP
jgi:hypothetical protein